MMRILVIVTYVHFQLLQSKDIGNRKINFSHLMSALAPELHFDTTHTTVDRNVFAFC